MRTTLRILAAASLAAATLNAYAATNPTAASADSSQGDFDITLNLTPHIIINSLEDMTLTATTNSDISDSQAICVGGFGFTDFDIGFSSLNGTTGSGTSAPFVLTGATDEVFYNVAFANDEAAISGTDANNDGTMSTSFTRQATIADCTGGGVENARIFITVPESNWQNVEDSTFQDTLTVTVAAL